MSELWRGPGDVSLHEEGWRFVLSLSAGTQG